MQTVMGVGSVGRARRFVRLYSAQDSTNANYFKKGLLYNPRIARSLISPNPATTLPHTHTHTHTPTTQGP